MPPLHICRGLIMKWSLAICYAGLLIGVLWTCGIVNASEVDLAGCRYSHTDVAPADLSTTNVDLTADPHWMVTGPTGTLAPGHTSLSSWVALPSNWVQPSAPSQTADSQPMGQYTYTISVFIPCDATNYDSLQIVGDAAADNDILSISANGNASVASCITAQHDCFKYTTHFVVPQTDLHGGLNTLTIVVYNQSLYSGLAVVARSEEHTS